jgi:uncharacterized protein
MFTLKVDEIPEEGLDLSWKEERTSLLAYMAGLSRIDFDFETPLQGEVKIKKTGRSVLITGTVETTLQLQCVRCLKEFSYPLSTSFDLTLYPIKEAPSDEEMEVGSEEMESGFFERGEIHLSEIACEQIFLELPYQPICEEGCRGLCPTCGRDLNLSSCECVKEEFPSGFSSLKKLKLD